MFSPTKLVVSLGCLRRLRHLRRTRMRLMEPPLTRKSQLCTLGYSWQREGVQFMHRESWTSPHMRLAKFFYESHSWFSILDADAYFASKLCLKNIIIQLEVAARWFVRYILKGSCQSYNFLMDAFSPGCGVLNAWQLKQSVLFTPHGFDVTGLRTMAKKSTDWFHDPFFGKHQNQLRPLCAGSEREWWGDNLGPGQESWLGNTPFRPSIHYHGALQSIQ